MEFLKATPAHDGILVRHYLAIWDSYDTPSDHFDVEPEDIVRRFIEEGRALRQLATFLAFDDDSAAGAVSCQLHLSPFPRCYDPKSINTATPGAFTSSDTIAAKASHVG